MARLTNSIDYCAIHCDFGKRGVCFFKDKSKCYEKSMFDRLKAYEEVCSEPEKLKLINKLYLERCEEINMLKAELAEIRKQTVDELVKETLKQFTEFDLKHGYPTVGDCKIILRDTAEKLKEVQDVN